jgi:hypothetical protein
MKFDCNGLCKQLYPKTANIFTIFVPGLKKCRSCGISMFTNDARCRCCNCKLRFKLNREDGTEHLKPETKRKMLAVIKRIG